MENGKCFKCRPGKIVLENQEDEEDFDNLINDLQHHHNDDNSDYIPDNYYGYDDILGSWEAQYATVGN